jgi:tripartite-type tricarboxylate transporter receptor subunit TctC
MKKLLLSLAAALLSHSAAAQPSLTRFVVPYPPGGGTDITARAYAEAMRVALKRNVIVENRPGAGGLLGAASVAKGSPADGSVVLLGNVVINVLSAYTHRNLQYDPVKDLAPVSLLARVDIGLAVGPMVPAKDLKEFIAWAKANPKQAAYGHPAAGSLPHFFGLLLGQAAGIDLLPVPYKGSPAMNNDLMGGQVASVVNAVTDIVPLHKAGRIRMLATAGDERSRAAPEVPTFRESGFPAIRGTSWFAMFAPAGTPPEEIARLSRAVRDGAADLQVRKAIEAIGIDVAAGTPEELANLLAEERARWAPVVKASGFTSGD